MDLNIDVNIKDMGTDGEGIGTLPSGKTVFVQGIAAAVMDAIVSGILGAVLLKAYASTKTGKATLSRDN